MAEGADRDQGRETRLAGRYRLQGRLYEQDGSPVWKAADEILGRPVMVRTFTPGFPRAGAVVAAARAAGRLNDPRLVQIFDADDRPECPYIVTEWPPGTRLDDLLAAGPLGPQRAGGIIAEAAGALAAAHAAGLAHLCLTPASVWCDRWGEVKISGLGTAAAITAVTAADPVLEDTRGLARLLFAALTGCWPGSEQTTLAAAPRQAGRLLRPRQMRAGIPHDIDAITCRALFGEPDSGMPPIFAPAQLAAELAVIAQPGGRPGLAAVPAAALTKPLTPVPAEQATARAAAPTPVTPVLPLPPIPGARLARPLPRATAAGSRPPRRPTRPARRARAPAGKILRGAAAMVALAAIAATAWIAIHAMGPHHGTGVALGPGRLPVARTLTPLRATGFDPYGDGQGENSQLALLAVDADPATAWHTDWYTTARFGNLKAGTGLLLDMGRNMTVTSATVTLGATPGTDLQLRAGAAGASLAALRPVARATGASGQVTLRPATSAHGRYLLIWFTRLPPDGSGTFQASVYAISVKGST